MRAREPIGPAFYGLSAAARLAGVSEPTMRRYADAGIVTSQRDSAGRRTFTLSAIAQAKDYRSRTNGCGRF